MTVKDVYDLIDRTAPFETQADFDNSGLLVGFASQEINGILFALDLTEQVIDEAVRLGVQLIVTHHPLMISPIRSLTDGAYESRLIRRLIRENISHIAAHTNLDQASGGINDILAERCGLTGIAGSGFFRFGSLPSPMTAQEYAAFLRERLHGEVRLMGPGSVIIRKVGLCSGSGSEEWPAAKENGCQAFVTGEIRHHIGLAMADSGIAGFECGHFCTEEPGIRSLASTLQKAVNTVECNVRIYVSGVSAYSFPRQP